MGNCLRSQNPNLPPRDFPRRTTVPLNIDSLPTFALDRILFYVDLQDRINLMAVSQAMQKAIAKTTLCSFNTASSNLRTLELSESNGMVSAYLGGRLFVRSEREMLHLRQRLFKAATVDNVLLKFRSTRSYPMFFVSMFLMDVSFTTMDIIVDSTHFDHRLSAFIAKHSRKIRRLCASVQFIAASAPYLSSLPLVFAVDLQGRACSELSDETFLTLVNAKHKRLVVPKACCTENAVLMTFQIIAACPVAQDIQFTLIADADTALRCIYKYFRDHGYGFLIDCPVDAAANWTRVNILQSFSDPLIPQGLAPIWLGTVAESEKAKPSINNMPSDVINEILSYLDLQDRLNLRAVSPALEAAITGTTWYNSDGTLEIGHFECDGKITVRFGPKHSVFFDHNQKDEVLRLRERLFSSARVKTINLTFAFSLSLPISFLEELLKNITFKEMTVRVFSTGYPSRFSQFIREHCEKSSITLVVSPLLVAQNSLSLPPLPTVMVLKTNAHDCINDDTLLRLIDANHSTILMPRACHSEHTLLTAFMAIEASPVKQYIKFLIDPLLIVRFFTLLGYTHHRTFGYTALGHHLPDFAILNFTYQTGDWTGTTLLQFRTTLLTVVPANVLELYPTVRIMNRQPPLFRRF